MNRLSPEARALFEHARDDLSPRDEDRARLERAILLHVGAASIATGAATKAAAASAGKGALVAPSIAVALVKWISVIAIAGGIGAGGAVAIHRKLTASAPSAAPAATVEAPPARAPLASSEPPPPATTATAEPIEAPAPTVSATPTVSVNAPGPSQAPSRGSVAEEARLLRDANAALQRGDGARALALLEEHRRTYPKGTLSEEGAAERVFALCRTGRVSEARQEAQRFLQAHPKSPLIKTIRSSCGFARSEP